VPAQDLFTDGNSLLEWGYDPQEISANDKLVKQIRQKLHYLNRMINGEIVTGLNKAEGDSYFGKTPEELTQMRDILVNNYKDVEYKI
jgi:hypothetical protein